MTEPVQKNAGILHHQLTKSAVLLALALIFQIGFMPFAQPVVGPLVNMTLLLAVLTVGPFHAVMIGCITPVMAFMLGIMPMPLLVPVVVLGNAAFITVFYGAAIKMKRINQMMALVAAALFKYAIMAASIRLIAAQFMPGMPDRLIHAFSLPQFYTAMLGGMLALLIGRYLPKEYTSAD